MRSRSWSRNKLKHKVIHLVSLQKSPFLIPMLLLIQMIACGSIQDLDRMPEDSKKKETQSKQVKDKQLDLNQGEILSITEIKVPPPEMSETEIDETLLIKATPEPSITIKQKPLSTLVDEEEKKKAELARIEAEEKKKAELARIEAEEKKKAESLTVIHQITEQKNTDTSSVQLKIQTKSVPALNLINFAPNKKEKAEEISDIKSKDQPKDQPKDQAKDQAKDQSQIIDKIDEPATLALNGKNDYIIAGSNASTLGNIDQAQEEISNIIIPSTQEIKTSGDSPFIERTQINIDQINEELKNKDLTRKEKRLLEKEKQTLEKIEKARLELEKLQKEREKAETERLAKLEAERLAKLEAERLEAERLAKLEAERLEAERLAKLEAEKLNQSPLNLNTELSNDPQIEEIAIIPTNQTSVTRTDDSEIEALEDFEIHAPTHISSGGPKGEHLSRFLQYQLIQYPKDQTLSPMDQDLLIGRWQQIAKSNPNRTNDSFIRIGDSLSTPPHFLHCVASGTPKLGKRQKLNQIIKRYRQKTIAQENAFEHNSISAKSGASINTLINRSKSGGKSLLEKEFEINPGRFALVMLGTNDIDYHRGVQRYINAYAVLMNKILDEGVIPILFTMPPREKYPTDANLIKDFNFIVRGMAVAFQVPFIDYHTMLLDLPEQGLRNDRIHLNAIQNGCSFETNALNGAHNLKNLVSLTTLDKLNSALEEKKVKFSPKLKPNQTEINVKSEDFPWFDVQDSNQLSVLQVNDKSPCKTLRYRPPVGMIYRIQLKKNTEIQIMVHSLSSSHHKAIIEHEGKCIELNDNISHLKLNAGQHQIMVYQERRGEELFAPFIFGVNSL